jgi:pimeloyl-ACP methyl ester carboxylesterase
LNAELAFGSGPRRLSGRLFSPARGAAGGTGILFIHGSGSDQSGYGKRAEAASRSLGAICLTFDLSGHGESDGSRTTLSARDHLGDCLDAFDALAAESALDSGRIGVCGASYGAYLAAMLIGHRGAGSLLLRAPALYPDSELDRVGGPLHSTAETAETATALGNVVGYEGPILIVESENDEVVPHASVQAYLDACRNGRLKTIPGTGHRLDDERSRALFVEIILDWFGTTLPRSPD